MSPDQAPAVCCGFPASYRLRKTDEFSSVFAFRRSLRSAHFVLSYRPNSVAGPRLGVVVPKRLVRQAVRRNLVKRLVRESFRLRRRHLPAHDLVLRLSARCDRVAKRVLRQEIESLLERTAR